jgi:hypothetical protein
MKKKMVFLAVAVALMAAGCGKTASVKPEGDKQSNNQPAGQDNGKQTTIKDLMASGSPQKCSVSYTVNDTQNQGTVYVAGGKSRLDFSFQVNGNTKSSSMINDGQFTYAWVDGMSVGYKMAIQKDATSTNAFGGDKSIQSIDPNLKYQFSCSGWTVDPSKFVPPSSVSFGSFGNFGGMGKPQSGTPEAGNKSQSCSACDYAGSGKAQCLAALHCN